MSSRKQSETEKSWMKQTPPPPPTPGRFMWNDPDVCRSGRPEVTSGQPWLYYGISAERDGCIWRAVGGRQGPSWPRRVCLHESVVQAKSLLQKHTLQNRNTVSAGTKYKYICSLGSRMRDRRHCFITVFTENNHFWRDVVSRPSLWDLAPSNGGRAYCRRY